MSKYMIYIRQSHSFMSDEPCVNTFKQNDISEMCIPERFFTQIGKYPNCVCCRELMIKPSGLTIPIYIHENDKFETILDKLNNYIRDDGMTDDLTITLKLDELGHRNYQTITIQKMRD